MPSPNPLVVLVATGETRGKISLPSADYHLATWRPSISATTHRCPGLAGRHGFKYATRNNVRPQADRTVREQAQKRRKKIEANGSSTKNFFCPSGMPVLVLQLADPEKKYRATLFLPFPSTSSISPNSLHSSSDPQAQLLTLSRNRVFFHY